ncbi:AAA family ATPase [Methylohalobius crimeensis]|uniref:AAA family ATPase n=1 Tax=Methylohalobius crimeensis TaxID=244365 RepID=UPI0003B66BF5|nr:ATP-binding protein [Methylohalobius crimeensis]
MLSNLNLTNFTVFKKANLRFSEGLNVIVGENGTGKTHLLKLGYLISTIWETQVKDRSSFISKESIERHVSERLLHIFKPERIGNLTTGGSRKGTSVNGTVTGSIPTVTIRMPHEPPMPPMDDEITWAFQFSDRAETKVSIDQLPERLTSNAIYGRSVYLPSKEMISFFEGFISLYETRELSFDETFRDLAVKLSSPRLKERPEFIGKLLERLGNAIGGDVILEGGRFYTVYTVRGKKRQRREITLLAEGLRKLATIMQLLDNGSLQPGGTLFWDEPETNLNPRLIKLVAEALFLLCCHGIQVILATHSLFLLRELEILSGKEEFQNVGQRYFALKTTSGGVIISQGGTPEDIDPLILLDESLEQSDRFLAI